MLPRCFLLALVMLVMGLLVNNQWSVGGAPGRTSVNFFTAQYFVNYNIPGGHEVEPLVLPARSPNLNAFSERWVRSVKEECLFKVILIGERFAASGAGRICRALPCRAKSPPARC